MDSSRFLRDTSIGSLVTAHLDDDRLWLLMGTGLATVVFVLYYVTHQYPAYGGGLYLSIAEQIRASGYQPPQTIPYYTDGGVPFAYPPLLFYVAAVLLDSGIEPLTLTRILPGLVTIVYVIPAYYLARELLESPRQAGVATVVVAVTPDVLQWHLTAGGIVRAPAFLFTLTGLYCGVKLFRTGKRRWLVPAGGLFGVTLLSHPVYTSFFGLSYLVFYAGYDRSFRGLLYGAIVASSGIVIAAPWWLRIVTVYGIDPILSITGTHNGLVNGLGTVVQLLVGPLVAANVQSVAYLLLLLGGAYFISNRKFVIPLWLLVTAFCTANARFVFVPGALLIAAFVTEVGLSRVVQTTPQFPSGQSTRAVLLSMLVLTTVVGGVSIAPAVFTTFLSDEDMHAIEWAHTETPADAEFVVVGDAAEWFPYFAERTSLVGPWGVEWVSSDGFNQQIEIHRQLAACPNASCLTATLTQYGLTPDYVYVPKGTVTAWGTEHEQQPQMRRSLVASDRYRIVYENEAVVIVEVSASDRPYRDASLAVSKQGDSWTSSPLSAI